MMRAASRGLDGRYRSKEDDDRTTLVKFVSNGRREIRMTLEGNERLGDTMP